MFLKVSPSRQDGKISRPVRLAKTTKLVSYTDVNSTRHIVQMKLVWSKAMADGSDRYISKSSEFRRWWLVMEVYPTMVVLWVLERWLDDVSSSVRSASVSWRALSACE
uniref:Uncharacterized protein n=1 Tax=Brassica campestris TaxID=3711 RepID=M4D1W2_BRACM